MTDSFAAVVHGIAGLAVLCLGRRLFWLFVAVAGFVVAFEFVPTALPGQEPWVAWCIALVAGVVGALVAVGLQYFAAALAGFAAGAYAAVPVAAAFGGAAWIPLLGGAVGALLMLLVFDWALIALSALVGATQLKTPDVSEPMNSAITITAGSARRRSPPFGSARRDVGAPRRAGADAQTRPDPLVTRWYWQPRSPEESARALERILRHFLAKWQKARVLLIGYSRGADLLPFMASRLPADLAERVDLIALVGPGPGITFEFHYTDWISSTPRGDARPVQPEVEKLRGKKLLCVYGADETDSICPRLPAGMARVDERPGGHHFGGDYRAIADRILAEARR